MPRPAEPQLIEAIMAIAAEGLSYGQIVTRLNRPGVTRNSVAGIVFRHLKGRPEAAVKRTTIVGARMTAVRQTAEERQKNAERQRLERDEARRQRMVLARAHSHDRKARGKMTFEYQTLRRERLEGLQGLEMRRLQFDDLTRKSCRWVEGDVSREHFYCGLDAQLGSSYCPCHHAVTYDRLSKAGDRDPELLQRKKPSGFFIRRHSVTTGSWTS